MKRYNPVDIESKWQQVWDETGIYQADLTSKKPKYIAMSMFNYPSGAGIHIGHAMNYTISDVKARFKRQQGYESYHPVGWDAFGLPAENYAIKSGVSPQKSMASIIPNYHKQYKAMGWSNDWSKEISTHMPEYYKWTQWIFSEMYRAGLAYQDARVQWWCDKCQTVLANEQVIDGKCWRHDGADDPIVEKREVKQWFFKITDYADELLEAIDDLDWTESVKLAQKNWIGRSKGAEISFQIQDFKSQIPVFTTRPDTLFGVTFLVLAPEHELVSELTAESERAAVDAYIKQAQAKSEVERQAAKDKTGVFTGTYAINPANGEAIPIWVADYVLGGYGTGAIMAVPAHDERDYAFASAFKLPVKPVVAQDFGEQLEDEVNVEGVVVVGYDPATHKFLGLRNASGSIWLCGGGRETSESFAETAQRELQEETGYAGDQPLRLGVPIYSHYHNNKKKSNRRSFAEAYLYILDSAKVGQAAREAHEDFVPEWFDFDELYSQLEKTDGGVGHWLEVLRRAKAAADAYDAGKEMPFTVYHGEGILINSGAYDGMTTSEARESIVADLEKKGAARFVTNYKMRDWSVSRQRYWGAPIPIVHCAQCGPVLVPDEQLPVVLPELDDFQPSGDGRSALARATEWLKVSCPNCGGAAERETDTLDTYICSSWYMYRYFDPANNEQIFDPAIVKKWEPIDFYNGADHATAHLLYARFIGHFFARKGLVNNPEPFKRFLFNGKVTASDGTMFSKSKGNGVDPLEIIGQGYGADALRTYLMFAAPLEVWAKWDPQGVPGTYRFLSRAWALVQEYATADVNESDTLEDKRIVRVAHQMVKKMTDDIEHDRYNTAIAAAMTAVNDFFKLKAEHPITQSAAWREALEMLVAGIAPFAPHIAEELWHELGNSSSVHVDSWPHWNELLLLDDILTLAVQINGRLRGEIAVARDASEDEAMKLAREHDKVAALLAGGTPKRVIYVPGRILNIVI